MANPKLGYQFTLFKQIDEHQRKVNEYIKYWLDEFYCDTVAELMIYHPAVAKELVPSINRLILELAFNKEMLLKNTNNVDRLLLR